MKARRIHLLTVTVTIKVDHYNYALEYGLGGAQVAQDITESLPEQVRELISDQGKRMGAWPVTDMSYALVNSRKSQSQGG
ncbi:MAG TPA: hypothetical protein VK735_40090 [Pseudonocardia sp.]|uniref:hypothetical protein n=1 Tax=Pseudonocardia sp. TaxID=60912 RepID=UPI002CF6E916|nr:hypothetical protein [Pseudonocardia sp.]HTF53686.1 hypothetical protein [Pseudonocardia sp.]